MSALVKVEKRDKITWVLLNRPEKLNALSRELMNSLYEEIDKADRDPGTGVIILSGEGRVFSAGIDLYEVSVSKSVRETEDIFSTLARMFRRIMETSKPVILALNGDAYGGGAELVWAADIVVSVEDARIGWVESRWGLVPPMLIGYGSYVMGFSRAALLALSAGVLSAREAYQYGIVAHLTTRERLREDVEKIARAILENSAPESIASIKKMIRSLKTSLLGEIGVSELLRLSRSEDLVKRASEFIEKKTVPRYL